MDNNKNVTTETKESQEKTEVDTPAVKDGNSASASATDSSQKKKRSKLKLAAYVVSALLLLFIVVIFSLGAVVKVAVNNVLPKVMGTPCSMGACTFNPIIGKVSISNLKIGNPEGYAKENAFNLGSLVVDIGVTSLFSDIIVIEEISVKGMNVDFEVKLTETNLSKIKGNIDEFTKADDEAQETASTEPEKEEPAAEKSDDEKPSTSKKLRITIIQFADNSMSFGTAGETASIPFADMTIKDIGSGPEGATVGEVSTKIFMAIYEAVLQTAKDNGMDSLNKSTGEAYDKVKKGTGKAYDKVKGWFGGEKK